MVVVMYDEIKRQGHPANGPRGGENEMAVVLLARAHPPAKNAGRVGQPLSRGLERMGQPSISLRVTNDTSVTHQIEEMAQRSKSICFAAPHGIYPNSIPHLTLGALKRSTSPEREIPASTLT
jgi:hypothetical protein